MNRIHLYPRYLGLLLLLPCFLGIRAQSAGLEYWFDKYSSPKVIAMPGGVGTLKSNIDVSKLTQGFHTIYMRAKASDGTYSPITSSSFIKFAASGDSKLEYWFDNDVTNLASLPIDVESGVVQLLDLDMTDAAKFPNGVHQLSMRVAAYGGHYSPVYSALVLKLPAGTGNSVLEYWFDDNIAKQSSIPIDITSGNLQKLDLDMKNTANFPLGFHKLNMRIDAYGGQYSSIYSAYVMRLPNSIASQITYWLDDDYKSRRVVNGMIANMTTSFILSSLDFSTTSVGMHRFKCRISYNGYDEGVIYEVPILITKMYNNQTDATIVTESYWIDEILPPVYKDISNPKAIFNKGYLLNPDNFSVGQHAFHIQFKNSAEVWSESNATYFYKDEAGMLRLGFKPSDVVGIDEATADEYFLCSYNGGTIYVDCQSPKLASTGIIVVYDMMGKVLARKDVSNVDGIHAEINLDGLSKQLLIVRLMSGDAQFTKKMMVK